MHGTSSGRRTDLQLLGTWQYGKKGTTYQIRQTDSGQLEFEGPHTATGTVIGLLRPRGEWLQADLTSKEGQAVGKIRLRFVKEFGSVCSNFKNGTSIEWGKDIFAHRQELALADGASGPPRPPLVAASPAPEPAPKEPRPKRAPVEVDPEEPLLLVGECNQWNVGEAKKKFAFSKGDVINGGRLHILRVEVDRADYAFQVISASKGWDFRLYPPLPSRQNLNTDPEAKGAAFVRALGADSRAGDGRNFHVVEKSDWSLEIRVWLLNKDVMAMFYGDSYDRLNRCWGPEVSKTDRLRPAPPFPKEVVPAAQKQPQEFAPEEVEPLQLVGECCKWKVEIDGLQFQPAGQTEDPGRAMRERHHKLVFRMQAKEVDFQIVSRKLGFSWRLFPCRPGGVMLAPGLTNRTEAKLGGESDGHKCNFMLQEDYLNIVQLSVTVEEQLGDEKSPPLGRVHVSYAVLSSAKPQVGIAPTWVQFPPKELCFLDDEFLVAAKTDGERHDALEKRNKLIRDIAFQLQEEYKVERVQGEVLALRKLYPHHGKKGTLALELDQAFSSEAPPPQAAAEAPPESAAGLQGQEGEKKLVEVLVHVCRELEIASELTITVGTTAQGLREEMARLDVTGTVDPEAFGLKVPGEAEQLDDSAPIMEDMRELECCDRGLPTKAAPTAPTSAPGPQPEPESRQVERDGSLESQELQQEMALRLRLTQKKLEELRGRDNEGDGDESFEPAVRSALQYQLEQQEKAYTVAVRLAGKANSADGAREKIAQKFAASFSSVFGPVDMQWSHLVSQLPAVIAARQRALKAQGVSPDLVVKAMIMIAERDEADLEVAIANLLIGKRLRFWATPHPSSPARVAEVLRERRVFVGEPRDWFHNLDIESHPDWTAVRPDLEKAFMGGAFKQPFGGKKSGKFGILSDEEMFSKGWRNLLNLATVLKDQLALILDALGCEGKGLRVEPRVLVAFHTQGEVLPPWTDSPGTARRLSLVMQLSAGHTRPNDGAALRLAQRAAAPRGGEEPLQCEVSAAGGHWCVFYTQEFTQAVEMVKLPVGRWCILACAEDAAEADKDRRAAKNPDAVGGDLALRNVDNFGSMKPPCSNCGFSAGDGIIVDCEEGHRLCRECLQQEIRKEGVPTCPACVSHAYKDRVYIAYKWDFFGSKSLERIGCVCPEGQVVDVGAKVLIAGQSKAADLNGKLGETIWWDKDSKCWDVRVFANGRIIKVDAKCLHLAESCPAGGSLSRCPCWPSGRGLFPISLGCRCCVKQGIVDCSDAGGGVGEGWPYFHGMPHLPFDWNLTSLDGVLFFLRHNFNHFFWTAGMKVVKAVNNETIKFDNFYSSMHAFIHHHPVKHSDRLAHRFDRFTVLCQHARNTRGARPVLFVRYVHDSREFARIDELYALLRLWTGARTRLCVVAMRQRPQGKELLYRHARHPRVLYYLVGEVGVMDFRPIVQACRFAVYDEAGLLQVETIQPGLLPLNAFRDPYTTKSTLCEEGDWLTDVQGKDPAFYPDCPKCQEPFQGQMEHRDLLAAVSRGDLAGVEERLSGGGRREARPVLANTNCWDEQGRRPLHLAAELEGRRRSDRRTAVRLAASLILAHADPQCHDRARVTALEHSRRHGASPEFTALLAAAALEEPRDARLLHAALELLEAPKRCALARVLGVDALRALGDAEYRWRNPPPDSEAFIDELEEVIAGLERLPEQQRRREMKKLLLEWHPDKNGSRYELATTVFQYLQANKDRVIKR